MAWLAASCHGESEGASVTAASAAASILCHSRPRFSLRALAAAVPVPFMPFIPGLGTSSANLKPEPGIRVPSDAAWVTTLGVRPTAETRKSGPPAEDVLRHAHGPVAFRGRVTVPGPSSRATTRDFAAPGARLTRRVPWHGTSLAASSNTNC
jgi:hypothetical protein